MTDSVFKHTSLSSVITHSRPAHCLTENSAVMSIRDRIREALQEQELTVQGASKAAGLGQTTLRDFLNDEDRSITLRTLEKLAPVLHKSVKWLQTGEPDGDPEVAELIDIFSHQPPHLRRTLLDVARSMDSSKRKQS